MTTLYREMSPEQLEIAYSPSSAIGGDYAPFVQRYVDESAWARESLRCLCDVRYGDENEQVFDLFYANGSSTKKRPLHLFIHGGYWQELSQKESATMAKPLVERGVTFVAVNYTLAPDADIEQMVDDCHRCLVYLVQNSNELGIDPDNISISGHSAGAQLLMHMLAQYQDEPLMQGVGLVVLISGIYDLTPICHTSINEPLFLDQDRARRLSPQFAESTFSQSVLIAIAEKDTGEFRRQAKEYHEKLIEAGTPSRLVDCGGLNHFNIILEMEKGAFPIIQSIVEFSIVEFSNGSD